MRLLVLSLERCQRAIGAIPATAYFGIALYMRYAAMPPTMGTCVGRRVKGRGRAPRADRPRTASARYQTRVSTRLTTWMTELSTKRSKV